MAVKRIKKQEHEKLSDANIAKVMALLESDKPISKKDACSILNIAYNTTRLANIIEGYKAKKANYMRQREKNRGKPATDDEIKIIIKGLLEGENISNIANSIFRSSSFVKGVLDKIGIPQKALGDAKYTPGILPDECVSEDFEKGEIVWSAKYHAPAKVIKRLNNFDYEEKYGCPCYNIYVIEKLDDPIPGFPRVTVGGFYANQLAYDLGSLKHLQKYGIENFV